MGILSCFSRSSKINQPNIIWMDGTPRSGLKKPAIENVSNRVLGSFFDAGGGSLWRDHSQ